MTQAPMTCANLDGPGRRARLYAGLAALLAGGILTWLFPAAGVANPWIRATVAVPFFFAVLGFLQAKEKTCVLLAAQGTRSIGKGIEKVPDAAERKALRGKGLRIVGQSIAGAVALTLAALFVMWLRS